MPTLTANPASPLQAQLDAQGDGDLVVNLGDGNTYNQDAYIWLGRVPTAGGFRTRLGNVTLNGDSTITASGRLIFAGGDTPLSGDEFVTPNPYSGSRRGVHLANRRFIACYAGPLTNHGFVYNVPGDGWAGCTGFRLSLAGKFDALPTDAFNVVGLDSSFSDGVPGPWLFGVQANGGFNLAVLLADGVTVAQARLPNQGSAVASNFTVDIQPDFAAGTCAAWFNNQPVAVTLTNFSPGMRPAASAPNDFKVLAGQGWTVWGVYYTESNPFTPGQAITAGNGRFWDAAPATFWYLNLDASLDSGRALVAVCQSSSTPYALLLETAFHADPSGAWGSLILNGQTLSVSGGTSTAGAALTMGPVQTGHVFTDPRFDGGGYGFFFPKLSVAYKVHMVRPRFSGSDVGLWAGNAMTADIQNAHFLACGRHYWWTVGFAGSVYFPFCENPTSRCLAYFRFAGGDDDVFAALELADVDDEGGSGAALVAPVVLEAGGAGRYSFSLMNTAMADKGGGRPVVLLNGAASATKKCNLSLFGVDSTAAALASGPGLDSGRWLVVNATPQPAPAAPAGARMALLGAGS